MKQVGGGRQYLAIDLASEQWEVHLIPTSVFERYLGGAALALHLWQTHVEQSQDTDPLCLACGSLSGSQTVCSSSLSLVGRSPVTALVESDTSITRLASVIVSCGWRAIVLTGIARRQMMLKIHQDRVEFVPSDRLIGKTVFETERMLAPTKDSALLAIGPAGEHAVAHACAVSDGIPLERRGFGALLGKKHIKAIMVDHGSMEFAPSDAQQYSITLERMARHISKSKYAAKFKVKGSLGMVDLAMERGFAAVDSLSKRTDPRLFHLGPDESSRKFSLDSDSCVDCVLGCKKKVMRPGGEDMTLPDAFGMFALGSNVGNYDANLVIQWWHQCIDLGLHPVTAGMQVGMAMSCGKSISQDEGTKIRFGETDQVPRLLDLMAKGSLPVASADRTDDMTVNGRPMVPLDPRGAWGEALLIGLGEDFPLVPEIILGWSSPEAVRDAAAWVVMQENLLWMARSLGVCPYLMVPLLFEENDGLLQRGARKVRIPISLRTGHSSLCGLLGNLAMSLLGVPLSPDRLLDVGRRAVALQRALNEEGRPYPAEIPQRFLFDPTSNHPDPSVVPYRRLVERYRFLRAVDLAKLQEM